MDIIIFDDKSNLSSLSYLKRLIINHKNIFLFERKTRTGSAAVNFLDGLEKLKKTKKLDKYDLIAFSDQDDIWLKKKIIRGIKLIYEKNISLYCSNLTFYKDGKENGKIVKSFPQKEFDYLFEGGSAGCTYIFNNNLASLIINDFLLIKNNLWKYFSHDWFVYFIARKYKLKVYIDPKSYILYRIHDSNVHGDMNVRSINAIRKKLNYFMKIGINIMQEVSLNY